MSSVITVSLTLSPNFYISCSQRFPWDQSVAAWSTFCIRSAEFFSVEF